jgi:hypothetical protein
VVGGRVQKVDDGAFRDRYVADLDIHECASQQALYGRAQGTDIS